MSVITDHFTHYALAFVTRDQTAKTMAKVLYEQFITVFGMPTKLLSDHSMNFTSALVEELCSTFGIRKCQTTAYHTQCNGQVERFHQTLFRMIGKLAADKKAQWSAVSSYSPCYLMFRRCPRLPVDFYLPTMGAHMCPH